MSQTRHDFYIDTDGTLEKVSAELAVMPARVKQAQNRALRKLMTWLKRQVMRAAAAAAGVTQKTLQAALRYKATLTKAPAISIWIGTNPIAAHHLGTVSWTRRMKGARAGRRSFPGTWAWSHGKTAGVIMERLTNERLPIDKATANIHEAIRDRITAMQAEIASRYEKLMRQELNYALNVESRA